MLNIISYYLGVAQKIRENHSFQIYSNVLGTAQKEEKHTHAHKTHNHKSACYSVGYDIEREEK